MRPGDDAGPIIDLVNEMKDLLRLELEEAWIDVQRDVGRRKKV
jgi:hypothetical protein